jgi:hypothetical protein
LRYPVTLITTSHRKDIERFALLCDSIDRFITGYEKHYAIVNDDDLPIFAPHNTSRRIVLPSSQLLPQWLKPLPRITMRNGRRLWWSFRSKPVHGWHVQQILKIGAALKLPSQRFCIIDSDNVFFRTFDIREYAGGDRTPLYVNSLAIAANAPRHALWTQTCDRLLGQDATQFPADDYIGNAIVWDKAAVQDMTARIGHVTGKSWAAALCQARSFSEYLLYGHFVRQSLQHLAKHAVTTRSPVNAYWDDKPLGLTELKAMVRDVDPRQVALCVQSFSSTPVTLIREVVGL